MPTPDGSKLWEFEHKSTRKRRQLKSAGVSPGSGQDSVAVRGRLGPDSKLWEEDSKLWEEDSNLWELCSKLWEFEHDPARKI